MLKIDIELWDGSTRLRQLSSDAEDYSALCLNIGLVVGRLLSSSPYEISRRCVTLRLREAK